MVSPSNPLNTLTQLYLCYKISKRYLLLEWRTLPWWQLNHLLLFRGLQLFSQLNLLPVVSTNLLLFRLKYVLLRPVLGAVHITANFDRTRLLSLQKLKFLAKYSTTSIYILYTTYGLLPHPRALQLKVTGYIVASIHF